MEKNPPRPLLSLIGNTPLVELTHFDTGPCRLFAKLENQNPGGSIKDRIGLSMIEVAEKDGRLKPGGHIIEATAGNTGLGLALVALQKGYKLTLVIPDKMSREKIFNLSAMGADIVLTRSDVGKGHPEYYQDIAARMAKETGAYYINQFENPANPLAHEKTTGPEIFAQLDGKVDAVVAGVGSGGTITGLARYFAKAQPNCDLVVADPVGSIVVDYVEKGKFGEAGSWLIEGIGEDFIPPVADLSRVKKGYSITDAESFKAARDLLRLEGILAGSSSGTLLATALKYCKDQKTPKNVVTFICDSGNKYLSKMFNDYWMTDQGFLQRERLGDLRDLISRLQSERAAVTVKPEDSLKIAHNRMRLSEISQLPVIDGERIVGLIDESDLMMAFYEKKAQFTDPVGNHMQKNIRTIPYKSSVDELAAVLKGHHAAIVVDGEKFLGLITRIDLVNHLRRKVLPPGT